jgi:hypothetical protein
MFKSNWYDSESPSVGFVSPQGQRHFVGRFGRLRKTIANEWLLALNGMLAVLFGVGVAIWPDAGALALLG